MLVLLTGLVIFFVKFLNIFPAGRDVSNDNGPRQHIVVCRRATKRINDSALAFLCLIWHYFDFLLFIYIKNQYLCHKEQEKRQQWPRQRLGKTKEQFKKGKQGPPEMGNMKWSEMKPNLRIRFSPVISNKKTSSLVFIRLFEQKAVVYFACI